MKEGADAYIRESGGLSTRADCAVVGAGGHVPGDERHETGGGKVLVTKGDGSDSCQRVHHHVTVSQPQAVSPSLLGRVR